MKIRSLFLASGAYIAMVIGLFVFGNAWLSFAIYHGLILVVMLNRDNRRFWHELFAGWQWLPALGAIVFGLGGGVILYLLAPVAGVNAETLKPVLSGFALTGYLWPAFILYHTFVNPFVEEVFWRGRLGSDCKNLKMIDFLFAGYHILVLVWFLDILFILLAFVILTVASWLWRQMRRKYGGLILPVLSHMTADGSIMFAAYFLSIHST